MHMLLSILLNALTAAALLSPAWVAQPSGTTASLRGSCAVSKAVAWASGTHGTYLRTTDGGATWRAAVVPGAEALDFRDIQAFDANTAYLLSIGEGPSSRVYRTSDGGAHWKQVLANPDAIGFFDALAFWDSNQGIVMGDPVDGEFALTTTSDGGKTWQRRRAPPALPGEGAFAASGTCLIVRGNKEAWFATGGPKAARVFHSTDRGMHWTVANTPVRNDSASTGIFSIAFADSKRGIAVGGDYKQPGDTLHNAAITNDGGKTWHEPRGNPPAGFRSAVAYLKVRKIWIASGTSGSDVSFDNGESWQKFDPGNFNAISITARGAGWAVGPEGRVAKLSLSAKPD